MLNFKLDRVTPEISGYKRKKRSYRRFTYGLLGIALSPVLAIGLTNYIIDPYGIFKTPTRLGFNLLKPAQDDQTRLFKAAEIIQFKPQRVLLGSSRAIMGLNPAHEAFQDNLVTYNLGLTGPNIRDIRKYLEHSLLNQPHIKQVVLSLDFFTFNHPKDKKDKPDNSILGQRYIPPGEFVRLTLSLDTLKSSQRTLEDNRKSKFTDSYYFYGMRRNIIPSTDKIKAFRHQIGNYLTTFYKDFQLAPESLQELEKIVALCKEKNIDLKVFISPIHATQLQTIEKAGLWDDFENWKRSVSKMTPYWDFATYNSVTEEPIANNMKNFEDSAHYRKGVGDWVLNRVFSHKVGEVPADFGDLISAENIEEHLKQVRLNKKKWEKENPDEVELVNDVSKKLNP